MFYGHSRHWTGRCPEAHDNHHRASSNQNTLQWSDNDKIIYLQLQVSESLSAVGSNSTHTHTRHARVKTTMALHKRSQIYMRCLRKQKHHPILVIFYLSLLQYFTISSYSKRSIQFQKVFFCKFLSYYILILY